MKQNIQTFIGCESSFEDSRMVLFGAPYDCTTSYRPGARFGSAAIRRESYGIETYSPYQDLDLTDFAVFDGGDLELPFGAPEKPLLLIEKMAAGILDAHKLPLMIGGEHLVTLGAVKAAIKRYPELCIVHFDAHTDLRQDYLGCALSHATVMRRCHDLVGDGRIFQFGIRSGDRPEFQWAAEGHVELQKYDFTGIEQLSRKIGDRPVYFTIDLDVLDPSIFPGTGTPEAGGVTFQALLGAIEVVSKLNVVAADINELSPPYDQNGASTALACKVLRELILAVLG